MHPHRVSCYIIGHGTLLIRCAEIALQRSYDIFGVVSSDDMLRRWAKERGIPHIEPSKDLTGFLSQTPFDYLFSIVNSQILSSEVLSLPGEYAINYHDALLPKYAGTNATSWALMNREKTHGITWHVMGDVVDAGDILKQRSIEVSDSETALTLNAKCYEAAVDAFAELADDLANGGAEARKQNLDERTFFPQYKRPPTGCVLSWNRCAYDIDAFIRALDFGPYANPLGRPKLAVGADFLIVQQVDVLDSISEAPPGTITGIDSDSLKISTASREIALRKVLTIDGQPLPILDFVTQYDLREGYRFRDIDAETAERITALNASNCKHEAFWVKRLATLQPLALPYATRKAEREKPAPYTRVRLRISEEVATFLEGRDVAWNASDFLLAAHATYLARIGGACVFDIGFREFEPEPDLAVSEGFFASIVPLRVEITDEQSFADVLSAMREQVELLRRRKTYARDIVTRYPTLRSMSELGKRWTFPVVVERRERLDDHKVEPGSNLTLVISNNEADWLWISNAEVLDDDSASRMLRQFTTFLLGIAADPDRRIADLPLLTESERHQLLVEWNNTRVDYPRGSCIHQLFEEQVEQTPDAIAVIFEHEQLTYWELNRRANQLAHHLRGLGVGPEVLVGICVERSLEMVVGLLGVLKAGGAYVPLDSTYPQERLAFMLEETRTPVLLTQQRMVETLPNHSALVVCLDTDWKVIARGGEENPVTGATPDNLAYVIYTSGSTGKPKGVCIPHRAVVRLVKGANYASLTSEEVFLQFAPLSFDAATFEIWGSLLNGARLVVFPAHTPSLEELGQVLQRSQITTLWLTAGLFHKMVEYHLDSLSNIRQLLAGGDVLSVPHIKKALEKLRGCQLINGYGPTESTTFTCCYSITVPCEGDTSVPIGRPISNTRDYVLDRYLQPMPIGLPGELYIGGDGLARGYLNRPELTAEKFVTNPFSDEPGARLYKTGDLARYRPDGNIEFLGRTDYQVKIRGFRIEPEEIEAVLGQHPAVQESVVIIREEIPGEKRLVAYWVANKQPAPSISELSRFLKEKLPDYMVPSAFVLLDVLPLTANGKVDRRELPAPDNLRPELEMAYAEPKTEVERRIASVWQEALHLEKVGVNDNFFDLGGHSLLIVQVQKRLSELFHSNISPIELFKYPTISSLAKHLCQGHNTQSLLERISDKARKQKEALARRKQLEERKKVWGATSEHTV